MITSLVGYSGFVGSNLAFEHDFSNLYNSKNIIEAYGTKPDILIYAGIKAEKFLANKFPENDYKVVEEAFENINKIQPKKVVLISTIDIYKNPIDVDEDSKIDIEDLHPYGLNRYYLEQWVEKEYDNSLMIRLPALYGKNIKKNFIYDMIHFIPNMLNAQKYMELCAINPNIKQFYLLQDNGFYKCRDITYDERAELKNFFSKIGFSALNFTDSRGSFQFYNLVNLWEHIEIAMKNGLRKVNIATEPITISDIYSTIKKDKFENEISSSIPSYDFRTKYSKLFGGSNGYIYSKDEVLRDIKEFVEAYQI